MVAPLTCGSATTAPIQKEAANIMRAILAARGLHYVPAADRPPVVYAPLLERPHLSDPLQEALVNFLASKSAWDRAHPPKALAPVEIPADDNLTSESFFAEAAELMSALRRQHYTD